MKRASSFGSGSGDVESRLWAKLRDMDALGYQWRRRAHFKSFTLDFVEHEAQLVIDLADGEPGKSPAPNIARDHVLAVAGYTVLKFRRGEAAHDLGAVTAAIRRVLEDRPSARASR